MSEEKEIIRSFNIFIEKWCGNNYPHLIDTDDNDGEKFRMELNDILSEKDKRIAELERGLFKVITCPSAIENQVLVNTCPVKQMEKEISSLKQKLETQRLEVLDEVERWIIEFRNPYPEDIFIEPTKEQFNIFNDHLKKCGLMPDAYNGSTARHTLKWVLEDVKQIIQTLKEKKDEYKRTA